LRDYISTSAPRLFEALTGEKEYALFRAAEGTGDHCETGARTLYHALSFGWLDRVLRPDARVISPICRMGATETVPISSHPGSLAAFPPAASLKSNNARLELTVFLAVRRLSVVEVKAGPVLSVSLSLAERPIGQPSFLERVVLAPERGRPQTLQVVGRLPDGATWPVNERALTPWVRRRRIRRVAAFTLLIVGLASAVFALLWPVRWLRPIGLWLPFGIHPVSGVTAVIGGLALAGVARGVRHGYRRAWLTALILLISTVYRLVHDMGLEGSAIACLFGLWLLFEHRHFRVSPPGFRQVVGWVIMTGLAVAALAAGLDAA
jgi:hypothetical protein